MSNEPAPAMSHFAPHLAHEVHDLLAILAANGYENVRLLPTGEYAATTRMAFTWALCLGLNRTGYRTRFCYDNEAEAVAALKDWDGEGFLPGYWIKQKPEDVIGPGDRAKFQQEAS